MRWIFFIFASTGALALSPTSLPAQSNVPGSNASLNLINSTPVSSNGIASSNSFGISTNSPAPVEGFKELLLKEKPPFIFQTAVTIFVSILTTMGWNSVQERRRRQQTLEKEFVSAIDELRASADEITIAVVSHITTPKFNQGAQKRTQATISYALKSCAPKIKRACTLLDQNSGDRLDKEFLKWKGELTGFPFPVITKDVVCKPNDAHVTRIHAAKNEWVEYLNGMTQGCLCGRLKIAANQ